MEFPDLERFPKGHPPSPYGKPVHVIWSGAGTLPKGHILKAVGWIESENFNTGDPGETFIDAFLESHDCLLRDGYRGIHSCTLCDNRRTPVIKWKGTRLELRGHGHYLVRKARTVYMAPSLLLHYVLRHKYLPPKPFIDAVLEGEFLSEVDLEIDWKCY